MDDPTSRSLRAAILVLATILHAGPADAGLPSDRPWQVVLREHLAGLAEVEFETEDSPVRPVEEDVDADTVYRDWLLLAAPRGTDPGVGPLPDRTAFSIPAREYLLAAIEADGGVWMSSRRYRPMQAAWWAGWGHPGNPHRESRAARLRAFVPAAVDMVMVGGVLDTDPPPAGTLSLHLLADTYAFLDAVEILPPEVRRAFEEGAGECLAAIETAAPSGGPPDMATVCACVHVARAADDPALAARAEALARRVVAERIRPAGYVETDGAASADRFRDAGFLAWAASAAPEEWDFLRPALAAVLELETALLLPEPGGDVRHVPTHFSAAGPTARSRDAAWRFPARVAGAMLTAPGICLLGPRDGGDASAWPAPAPSMARQIALAFPLERKSEAAAEEGRRAWSVEDVSDEPLPFDHDHYLPGTVARLRKAESTPWEKIPFERPGGFIRDFDREFLVAKLGGFGVIVHTGPIAAGDPSRGFSGGALSAFWTPGSGPVILGRCDTGVGDDWERWWRWQSHAVGGVDASGRPFSSARIARESLTQIGYDVGIDRATVRVEGPLHPPGAPGAALVYRRTFDVDSAGLRVETRLESDGKERYRRLCEVIPVFNDAPSAHQPDGGVAATVFFDAGKGWQPAPDRVVAGVQRVRIERHGGAVAIEFERAQRVGLAPDPGPSGHNILVELLRGDDETEAITVAGTAYSVRPLVSRR